MIEHEGNQKKTVVIEGQGWLKKIIWDKCSHGEFLKFDGGSMTCDLRIDGDGNSTRYQFVFEGDQWDGDRGPTVFEFYGQWEMIFLKEIFKALETIRHG